MQRAFLPCANVRTDEPAEACSGGRTIVSTGKRGTAGAYAKAAKMAGFIVPILIATKISLTLGALANAATVAFIFLLVVLLSAVFGDLLVAVPTSIVAALCFDYFFLPPSGTFYIASFSDWISFATFLTVSIIISKLSSAAAENRANARALGRTLEQMSQFGGWLTAPQKQLTLTAIAEEIVRTFPVEYCSIHYFGEGRWSHFSGSAANALSQDVETFLRNQAQDHPTSVLELADESIASVHMLKIKRGNETLALLAVKSSSLADAAQQTLATMIGVLFNSIGKT
jgi:K+-sensing histidine kinase KdpD